mmetsp:Transcript_488/g.679  ORF Transcript_488/g.679 Transcript_488/m.679 type:complete len:321 (-) Transcript_488:966-1928(-)
MMSQNTLSAFIVPPQPIDTRTYYYEIHELKVSKSLQSFSVQCNNILCNRNHIYQYSTYKASHRTNQMHYGLNALFKNGDSKEVNEKQENEVNLLLMEREVIASAQAKLDLKRIQNAVFAQVENDKDYAYNTDKMSITKLNNEDTLEMKLSQQTQIQNVPSQWNIALASAIVCGAISFVAFQIPILSASLFLLAFFLASRDPITENDGLIDGDDISGPIARTVGRATISSLEQTKPKVRAVTKAIFTKNDENDTLRQRIRDLEKENEKLKLCIKRRETIDKKSKLYTKADLKSIAKKNGLIQSGTKVQLMTRLIDSGSLEL